MSKKIDERVVEMQFDNKQFEQNVATSMSTLDKLKQSLNLTGATKGLENVDAAAKKVDMSSLSTAVETVRSRFSALEVMAVTALSNVTNSAVNAGKKIVSALTIDPITTGFQEYETQINAVQTILANTQSKGNTLSDVNAALDELNKYADQTIYNFTEMTRNIGTFTAAGVDLDKSVTSIKGIANLAAVSGSNAQQASTAMYQLSQALAAGKVSLMDWNSVVNAGMGGQVFQDALKRTAENFGYNVDEMITKYGSFRESLTEGGWLTAEVLTETLTQLSGAYTEADLIAQGYSEEQAREITELAKTAVDAATKVKTFTQLWDTLKEAAQSGWTQTWEILVGDFEEAKDLLTELSETFGEIINSSAEARNNLLYDAMTSNWKKITDGITEAGLSAEDFKTKVTEVSKAQGIDIDSIVADYGSLESAFKNGALSSDLLNQALLKMTGTSTEISKKMDDLRGKYKTNEDILKALTNAGYEYSDMQDLVSKANDGQVISLNDLSDAQLMSIGYTAEQVKSIRELANYAELAGGSLKKFMDNVAVPQGRELMIDALRVGIRSLIDIFGDLGQAWREVFPPATAEQVLGIVQAFRDFVLAIRPSEETLNKLQRTFRGLFSIISIGKEALFAIGDAIVSLLGNFSGLGGGILDVTASVGDWLFGLDQMIKETGIFTTIMDGLVTAIQFVVDTIRNFVDTVVSKFSEFDILSNLFDGIKERMSQVGDGAGSMKSGFVAAIDAMGDSLANNKIFSALQALWDGVKTVVGAIIDMFGNLASNLASAIGGINFSAIFDVLNVAALGGVAYSISNFLNALSDPLEGLQGLLDGVVGILDGVKGSLEAYQTQLQAGTLLKIATAIGILAASILVIASIDSKKLSASLGAVTVLFANLIASMALFGKISGPITGVFKTTTAMLAISAAVLVLATALRKVADLDFDDLVKGLLGIAALSATMIASTKALSKGTPTIIKGAAQMVIFAAAIKVLASACNDLAQLSWEGLAKGLIGVSTLLAGISLFLNTAKFSGKTISTSAGIVILASAIKILASACEDFGQMQWGEIGKGLASIGALLLEIAVFSKLTANASSLISTGVALVALGAAMKILASAVSDFSNMQWEELARGLTGMAGALLAVTVALNFMPKNTIGVGIGLVVVASSLIIMAEALDRLGGMTWDEIARGMTTLGGSMLILAVGLNVMTGTLSGSAAMLVAATSLAILAPVLKVLGGMSWESIAKGLVTIAGAFTVIGVAGLALTPLVPTILALSGSFALIGLAITGIGAGLLAAGAGLSAVAVGITALAASLAAGTTAIVSSLTVVIVGIASLIPEVMKKFGEGIVELLKVITNSAPAIGDAVRSIVLTLADVLVECVPAIADGVLDLISGVLVALVQYTPQIVDSIFQFLIKLLDGVAQNLPELITAAVKVVAAFFSGIIDALSGIDTSTLLKTIAGVGLLSGLMVALSAVSALIPGAMVGVLGLGVLIAELAVVLAAVGALAQIPGLDWLINEGATLLGGIGNAIGSFIGGIVGGIMGGVTSQFPKIASDLSGFMANIQPFVDGARKIDSSVLGGITSLAGAILILTAANIIEGLTSWFTGGSSLTKFAEELVPFGEAMVEFSNTIAGMDGELVANAATAGKALAEMAATIPKSGGIVGFFTGEGDMEAFRSQLVPFGEAMKEFSTAVTGMDSNAVVNAATAGKALAEMASTIPNSGGVIAFFAGENDMVAFGEQLVPFGKAMKEYSLAVAGLDVNAITNSMTAGNALIELSKTIPNTGGLVSFFTGNNDMSVFGEQLVSFGQNFKMYSDYMKNVDPNVVMTTTSAAQSLVTLSNSLPKNALFTDETWIDEFGEQLARFGYQFSLYYGYISMVDPAKLSSVITEVNRLVSMARGMADLDTSGMSSFSVALTRLGNTGIDGFVRAFENSGGKVSQAASKMLTYFVNGLDAVKSKVTSAITALAQDSVTQLSTKYSAFSSAGQMFVTSLVNGIRLKESTIKSTFSSLVESILTSIKNKYRDFNTSGQTLVTQFIAGIKSKETAAKTTMISLMNVLLTAIRSKYSEFNKSGQTLMTQFVSGLKSKENESKNTFSSLIKNMISTINGYYQNFYNAGKYLVEGFANGISVNTYLASARAREMANAAASAAASELDEHSPSKVGYEIGDYFGIAFVNAIGDYTSKAYAAGSEMANSAKTGLSNAVSQVMDIFDDSVDTQPTIRPVLDLSDIETGTNRLNAMFSRNRAMSISYGLGRDTLSDTRDGESSTRTGNVYSFTQNNYSPKELSRVEIYRQTKNQFSAFERMVKA